MPRFMGFVRMEEGVGTPPQALLRLSSPDEVLAAVPYLLVFHTRSE